MDLHYLTPLVSTAVVMSIGLSVGVYGPGEVTPYPSWCWIDTSLGWPTVFYWQLFCGKAWEMFSYVWVVVFYTVVRCFLKRQVGANIDGFWQMFSHNI